MRVQTRVQARKTMWLARGFRARYCLLVRCGLRRGLPLCLSARWHCRPPGRGRPVSRGATDRAADHAIPMLCVCSSATNISEQSEGLVTRDSSALRRCVHTCAPNNNKRASSGIPPSRILSYINTKIYTIDTLHYDKMTCASNFCKKKKKKRDNCSYELHAQSVSARLILSLSTWKQFYRNSALIIFVGLNERRTRRCRSSFASLCNVSLDAFCIAIDFYRVRRKLRNIARVQFLQNPLENMYTCTRAAQSHARPGPACISSKWHRDSARMCVCMQNPHSCAKLDSRVLMLCNQQSVGTRCRRRVLAATSFSSTRRETLDNTRFIFVALNLKDQTT
ncbi:unnamed protein product [Trichogramma brassicae]|uniref:Uncharacterized protein n=1 Tax=Trichogramma brassicae TaxID=86971 RepID=A0A6H5IN43_9HYME|nr:unnamed protein product [Trichogramma brassicae]